MENIQEENFFKTWKEKTQKQKLHLRIKILGMRNHVTTEFLFFSIIWTSLECFLEISFSIDLSEWTLNNLYENGFAKILAF